MALQAHIDYLRHVLQQTEHERNSAWGERDSLRGERDSLRGEVNSLRGERDSLRGERDTLKGERDSLSRERVSLRAERDKAQIERDEARQTIVQANAERDQLQQQLNDANAELKKVKQEHEERGAEGHMNNPEAPGLMDKMLHEWSQRRRQLMDVAQKDQTREQRVGRYIHYVGFAKAEMLFWETMVETEGRLEGRDSMIRSHFGADGAAVDFESDVESVLTPMSRASLV